MNRSEIINLYRENFAAQEKVARNASKLAFLACMPDASAYHAANERGDLERYMEEARVARGRFAHAVRDLSAEEVVSIIVEADA